MEEDNNSNRIWNYVGKYISILIIQNNAIISYAGLKCLKITIQKARGNK